MNTLPCFTRDWKWKEEAAIAQRCVGGSHDLMLGHAHGLVVTLHLLSIASLSFFFSLPSEFTSVNANGKSCWSYYVPPWPPLIAGRENEICWGLVCERRSLPQVEQNWMSKGIFSEIAVIVELMGNGMRDEKVASELFRGSVQKQRWSNAWGFYEFTWCYVSNREKMLSIKKTFIFWLLRLEGPKKL